MDFQRFLILRQELGSSGRWFVFIEVNNLRRILISCIFSSTITLHPLGARSFYCHTAWVTALKYQKVRGRTLNIEHLTGSWFTVAVPSLSLVVFWFSLVPSTRVFIDNG
ncbi:hypothetical protein ABKN59_009199 [Abortiporus biennis]